MVCYFEFDPDGMGEKWQIFLDEDMKAGYEIEMNCISRIGFSV